MLAEPFKTLWQGQDPLVAVEHLQGEVFRELEGRRTLRIEVAGQGYFVKIHRGVGWKEIVKNLLLLRLPVLGARNEWRALERLHQAGVPTMTAVGMGESGWNPATRHSFLITQELAPTLSLEELSMNWAQQPPVPRFKWQLIARVAEMTARMHQAGVNHRDCYICHFLLDTRVPPTVANIHLSLIDLHRAQTRTRTPKRWRNKDLAALYFSVLDIGLTQRDLLRFLCTYFQCTPRVLLQREARLLRWLRHKAQSLQARKLRHGDAL